MWSESKTNTVQWGSEYQTCWVFKLLRVLKMNSSLRMSLKMSSKKSDNVHENENRGPGNSGNSPNVINFAEEKFENVQIKQSERYWVPNKPPTITANPCLFTT